MKLRNAPLRIATGAYILHTGIEKWHGDEARAEGVHAMAAGAYPFLGSVPSTTFLRTLSAAEMLLGSALLAPFVSAASAGASLTAFAGGLLGMYVRTPAMHKPASLWPTPQGTAVSKDVWLLGIGVSLLIGGLSPDPKNGHGTRRQ